MRYFIFVSGTILVLATSTMATARTWNILPDGSGDAPTIQAGIIAAAEGDTVLVEPGLYLENIDFSGKNVTVASQFLLTGDEYYISQTVIDGGAAGSVVRFVNGEGRTAVLTGFTVTHGEADYGGGIACAQSNPSLLHLLVTGNHAIGGGGVHCSDGAGPLLAESTVSSNSTTISGSGGGVRCSGQASPTLLNVRIEGNEAQHGGGLYCYFYSSPTLRDVAIVGNTATSTLPSSPSGGGVYCGAWSHPRLERVEISGNMAGSTTNLSGRGGAVYCSGGSIPVFVNVTMTENSASFAGGAFHCLANAAPVLVNAILWSNEPEEIYFNEGFDPGAITIAYSDVQGGESGIIHNDNGVVHWLEANIDQDPLFADPASGDFQLLEGSPCIDAGTDFFVLAGDTLVDIGPTEFFGNAPDMGRFEFLHPLGIDDLIEERSDLVLRHSHPNPFTSATTLTYSLRRGAFVSLDLYDTAGRKVMTYGEGWRDAGVHEVRLDTGALGVGIYFAAIHARDHSGQELLDSRMLIRVR